MPVIFISPFSISHFFHPYSKNTQNPKPFSHIDNERKSSSTPSLDRHKRDISNWIVNMMLRSLKTSISSSTLGVKKEIS